jgi:hypothetical protein
MLAPAALLAAVAVAVSLGVAVCADAPARDAQTAAFGAAGDALKACVRRGGDQAAALRLALGRLE